MAGVESIDGLQGRLDIPSAVRFEAGNGGLIRAVITTPKSEAHVYLHGGHVTHFQHRKQKPLLFLSEKSHFAANKAIRGGVPICFPWFGPKAGDSSAPAHGFARLKEWKAESTGLADNGGVQLVLSLADDDGTRKLWPHHFRAVYRITAGDDLRLSLEVYNTGPETFVFEEALHTYFKVEDIRRVRVEGLEGTNYLDKLQDAKRVAQGAHPVKFSGETDRVYLDTRGTCLAHDPAGGRKIEVTKDGSNTTVIWNPWSDKARAMADFGDDEWPGMLCVETCNVGEFAVKVMPGKSHTMTAVIRGEGR